MNETQQQRSAVVFGARNLGRAVIERLRDDGWAVAAVARSESTSPIQGACASA
jgi:NAD(P)-dependent dehydrogenase (short-subunit alcohol dehydrogenase family)